MNSSNRLFEVVSNNFANVVPTANTEDDSSPSSPKSHNNQTLKFSARKRNSTKKPNATSEATNDNNSNGNAKNNNFVINVENLDKNKNKTNNINNKDVSKIANLWFEAQEEIRNGEQPSILNRIKANFIIERTGHRERAPTTWSTLQNIIDKKTDVDKYAKNIEAADFSDDEDEDEEASVMRPTSPKGHDEDDLKNKFPHPTIGKLWFKAQSQLQEGQQPTILKKHNITLQNVRNHNEKFKKHLKALPIDAFLNVQISTTRRSIAKDGDGEDEEEEDDEDEGTPAPDE